LSTTGVTTKQWQFPQDVRRTYKTAQRAQGIRIWDTDGREYIDADSGAISVVSIGHGVAEVVEAMAEQAARLAYVHDVQFQHSPAEELAAAVARFAPGSLNRTAFVSGGSEAVECAIKLTRNYHVLRGRESKHVVLSRARSYHGATLFALSVGGVPHRQKPYLPYMRDFPQVVPPYCYRCPLGLEYPACDNACATDLERAILEVGAEHVAAFISEPIVAAAGPGITPRPGYYERIREVCDRHDIVMIADEVVTGWGRTGRNFGIEHWGVEPDVIVSAKGLSGGYAPLGTVIMSDAIADTFIDGNSSFVNDFTYGAHPVGCAAGLAVLRIIERDHLVENAAVQGDYLFERLHELAESQSLIGDIRGKGLLAGLELVLDRASATPAPPELELSRRLHLAAQARGLMIYPGAGADGVAGDQVLVSPPLTVTREDIDEIVTRLAGALKDVTESLPGVRLTPA
jgi:adenosylmethionine-8-amino-7-oxononanoate aminotransferase